MFQECGMTETASDDLVRILVRARTLEEHLAPLRPAGLPDHVRGPLAVSPGIQAALVAAGSPSDAADVLCLCGASPASALALGVSPTALALEAVGARSAHASGRSGGGVPPMSDGRLLAGIESPGTMVEVMAGVALACRLRREPRAAILVDTADSSASGYWHEGLNLAAVQRAPLVLVIDSARRKALTAAVDRLAARAPAYGIRAVTVEGDDPHLVLEAIAEAAARARLGEGTQLVEVVPGSDEDPVERLVRLEPSRADVVEELRALALVEAREAADVAASAPAPDESDARHPVLVLSSSENSP